MGCSNNIIQNVCFQMKNIEIQFNNLLVQTQNYGLQNTICQTQDLGFQMINIGIQLLDIFTTRSNNINTFMIKQQIQNMISQMQNIEMKINIKNKNEINNNMMMMKKPNMMNIFESNNSMGDIINRSNENICFEQKETIEKYNATFIQQTGIRTYLILDKETTIKEMIELYLNRIGKELTNLKNSHFSFNGNKLDIDSNQSINEIFEEISNPLIYSLS